MFFDKEYVQRHTSFSRTDEFYQFLTDRVPAHIYYSSAYYASPGASTMSEKSWLGADLVFDLDADHVEGAEELSYPDMLSRVKREAKKLIDEFLIEDFGFDLSDMRIVFSGGRGYHVHVTNDRVIPMKSHERREIVDYITGTDLDTEWVFSEKVISKNEYRGFEKVNKVRLIPSPQSGGWRRRMFEGLVSVVDRLEGLSVEEVKSSFPLTSQVSDRLIEGMMNDLFSSQRGGTRAESMVKSGRLSGFSDRRYQALFLKIVEDDVKRESSSQVDEPVTSDIKRLIRLPCSLHGRTGLKVIPLSREEFEEFDPLRDAVPEVFREGTVRVETGEAINLNIGGEEFNLQGVCEVPTYVAIFLLCRGRASLEA